MLSPCPTTRPLPLKADLSDPLNPFLHPPPLDPPTHPLTRFHPPPPSFESKRLIEEHIHSLGLPATILRPAILMDGFLNEDWLQTKVLSTLMTQSFTSSDRRLQLVSCEDIGRVAAQGTLRLRPSLPSERQIVLLCA